MASVHGGIFDFALFMFHNAKEQIARGAGPFFYLPKMESHLEAQLWNDVFVVTQNELGPAGHDQRRRSSSRRSSRRSRWKKSPTNCANTAPASTPAAGTTSSCIKKFKLDKNFCLADRAQVKMTAPFMRAYACCCSRPATSVARRRSAA